jgi:5-methylcytosine-specific restriction protein A
MAVGAQQREVFQLRFSAQDVAIGKKSALVRGFESSVAFSKLYRVAALPTEKELIEDLREMARLYRVSIARGGVDSLDDIDDPSLMGSLVTVEERRRYRLHMVIEGRNSKAAQLAKKVHGYICQGCGFDFAAVYGSVGREYIEAHHLVPFASATAMVPLPVHI